MIHKLLDKIMTKLEIELKGHEVYFIFLNLFIYFCLRWVFIAARAFL